MDDARWQLQATAARVYGAALGSVLDQRSIDALEHLAKTEVADVGLAIGYSLAELVDADHSQARPVLERVLHWINDGGGHRNAAGEAAFLILAGDLIEPVGNSADPDARWPLMLRLSVADDALRGCLATAWYQTLSGRRFHVSARTIAGRWAERAERDLSAQTAFARMFTIAETGSYRTSRIVRMLATQWRNEGNDPFAPSTAKTVLAALP